MGNPDEHFVQLLSQHDRMLRAFILAIGGRPDLVDDVMQETAVILWRRRHDYEPQRPFSAWARGIARLVAWDAMRRLQRQPASWDNTVLDSIESAFADLDNTMPNADVRLEALEHCRRQLQPQQRTLLHRRYGLNESDANIAAATDRSIAAIHKALVRIRAALRRCVEQRLAHETGNQQ